MPLIDAFGTRVREDQRREREELHAAGPHLAQHVGVGAELVVGKDLDLDAAVRLLLDLVGRLFRTQVHRMRDRKVVGVFVGELGRLGAGSERADHRDRGSALQQGAA